MTSSMTSRCSAITSWTLLWRSREIDLDLDLSSPDLVRRIETRLATDRGRMWSQEVRPKRLAMKGWLSADGGRLFLTRQGFGNAFQRRLCIRPLVDNGDGSIGIRGVFKAPLVVRLFMALAMTVLTGAVLVVFTIALVHSSNELGFADVAVPALLLVFYFALLSIALRLSLECEDALIALLSAL